MKRRHHLLVAMIASQMVLPMVYATDADYEAPTGYYSGATGTGSTLKSQLTTIMTSGQVVRNYGQYRYMSVIIDADPNHAGNILLVYNRASVSASWDNGGTWNREHVWPDSLQEGNADNGATGSIGDPHALKPCNPSINSSRGNKAFDGATYSGSYGAYGSGYYPGDADRGDIARILFYQATRYSDKMTLINGTSPGMGQMGDLNSLLHWHYLDTPDAYERRRNQAIYSSTMNPSYYTNNRNAYIDRPEYVWSVFKDQANDSRLYVGSTANADGSSQATVNLGRVIVGAAAPATTSNVTLNKIGNAGTYYEVTTSGLATSNVTGHYNAFAMDSAGSRTLTVGLSSINTSQAGSYSGTVTVNNLDVTTGGGAGRGANDGNDTINISAQVLSHSRGSFNSTSQQKQTSYDFGWIWLDAADKSQAFNLYNLVTTAGYTADLDLDQITVTGNTSSFSTNLATFAGMDAGTSRGFNVQFLSDFAGSFQAVYKFNVSDENLAGATSDLLQLTVTGAVRLLGDYNGDGSVTAADYTVWADAFGTSLRDADGNGDGIVSAADYTIWADHFGDTLANHETLLSTVVIPEPASVSLLMIGAIGLVARRRR